MKNTRASWNEGVYYQRMVVFFIPYFILNTLDLVLTRIALSTSEKIHELNPLYYNPYFAPLKIIAPLILIGFYLVIYHCNKSAQGRRTIEKSGYYCILAMIVLYSFICVNNAFQCIFAV